MSHSTTTVRSSRRHRLGAIVLTFSSLALASAAVGQSSSPPPHVATLSAGGAIALPTGWSAAENGGVLLLTPASDEAAASPGLTGIFSVEAWDSSRSLTSDETIDQLREQYLAAVEGFAIDGTPLAENGQLRMQFSRRGENGAEARLHLFVKTEGDRLLTVAIIGPAASVMDRTSAWEAMFTSASRTSAASAATPRSDGMEELKNPTGGYSIRHPIGWTARAEGAAAMLLPDLNAATGANPELYGLNAMPWTAGRSLDDPSVAEEAATQLLAETPGLRRVGAIQALAGGGVMMRCVGATPETDTVRVRVLARNNDRTIVALVTAGDDASIERRESKARELFATLRFIEPTKAAAAAPGSLDNEVIGRWSSDDVLSSGSGFDSGGVTSMVTQRIIDFAANGTFTIGSRSAGGNSGMSFDSPFEITSRGSWSIERTEKGNFVVFTGDDGSTNRSRYVMHEGQLVFGQSGSRKFYSRIR